MINEAAVELTKKLDQGKAFQDGQKAADAIPQYEFIIAYKFKSADQITEETIKTKEQAAYRLAQIFSELNLFEQLVDLTKQILPLYNDLPKSKTGKIIRTLFDLCLKFTTKNKNEPLIELSKYVIDWCEKESRSFLRMKIENKLADLYFRQGKYNDSLQLLNKLLFELKKKDDK